MTEAESLDRIARFIKFHGIAVKESDLRLMPLRVHSHGEPWEECKLFSVCAGYGVDVRDVIAFLLGGPGKLAERKRSDLIAEYEILCKRYGYDPSAPRKLVQA